MVATRSSAWQSWHDPPQKTEVCLSLSASQVEPSKPATRLYHRHPSGKARRVTDAHDWRGFLERGRTSCTPIGSSRIHTRYSFAGSFVDLSIRVSLFLPIFPFFSNPCRCRGSMQLTLRTPSRGSFQCISPPAFTFHRIFLSKYFFNKHAYHTVDRCQRLDAGTSHWQVPSRCF